MPSEKSMLPKNTPIFEIVRKLRNEEVSWRMLSGTQVMESIALLLLDGATYASIAGLLGCSEKTVGRYAKKIRKANVFKFDLRDSLETIGEYQITTRHQLKRLEHIAATAKDEAFKTQAIALVLKLRSDYIKILMQLGCLPPTAFKYGEKLTPPKVERPKKKPEIDWEKAKLQADEFIKAIGIMLPHERQPILQALNRLERLEQDKLKRTNKDEEKKPN